MIFPGSVSGSAMNNIFFFKPHPALFSVINMIMVKGIMPHHGESDMIYSYPPTPEHCIFLYLNSPIKARKLGEKNFTQRSQCIIVGPQLTRVDIELPKDHRAVMIGFQPGGLFRFLGIPMTELFDDGYDGFNILDKDIHHLIEQLTETPDPTHINILVQKYLLGKVHKAAEIQPIDKALHGLLKPGKGRHIDNVAIDSCLSIRQFERKCRERLGMSPKLFSRIARFSKAYRMYEANTDLSWTDISYKCGYFDQMHFIKDFKEFAGVSPRVLGNKVLSSSFRFQAPINI